MGKKIIVYITADENRVLGGDPLTLLVKEQNEQKGLTVELGRALKADVVQLKNGDYVLITDRIEICNAKSIPQTAVCVDDTLPRVLFLLL